MRTTASNMYSVVLKTCCECVRRGGGVRIQSKKKQTNMEKMKIEEEMVAIVGIWGPLLREKFLTSAQKRFSSTQPQTQSQSRTHSPNPLHTNTNSQYETVSTVTKKMKHDDHNSEKKMSINMNQKCNYNSDSGSNNDSVITNDNQHNDKNVLEDISLTLCIKLLLCLNYGLTKTEKKQKNNDVFLDNAEWFSATLIRIIGEEELKRR